MPQSEERRECVLNSTPLESFWLCVNNQRRREKGMYSKFTPLESSFVFCISLFEKEEKGMCSKFHPPRIFLVVCISSFEKSEEKREGILF